MSTNNEIVWRRGKKVILRPIREDDLLIHNKWINDPENNLYLIGAWPVSMVEQKTWYEKVAREGSDQIALGIYTLEGVLIGDIELRIDFKKQSGVTGTLLGSHEHKGQGYGTDAKMLILDYAFNWLGLRKVSSRIFAFNGRSRRYGEKCGYRHMATIEKEHFRNGEWIDEVHYVVFREEWLPLWEEYQRSESDE